MNTSQSGHTPVDAEGCVTKNVKRISHLDLPGGAQIVAKNGYLYVGHNTPPDGTTIIDVRDPMNPVIATSITLPDTRSHSHKVMVSGDLMVVNSQRHRRKFFRKSEKLQEIEAKYVAGGGKAASDEKIALALGVKLEDVDVLRREADFEYKHGGFCVYDISTPAAPRRISFQPTGGMGAHGFDFDGRYAYVSTEMTGFMGNILVIYDLTQPDSPQEVSRWWMPGQEAGGSKSTGPVNGNWLHHALKRDDMLWAACCQAGIWAIDISDKTRPVTAGVYNYHPPFPEPTHTVMALPQTYSGRKLALAIDEEHDNHPKGQPHAALWILDITEPENITPLSVYEVSEMDSPWSRIGSRFGASQIVEHPTGELVFAAWFAGGLRVIDIANPEAPREYGYFIPTPIKGFQAPQSMDAEVDERGIIYLLDRNSGLDILELS